MANRVFVRVIKLQSQLPAGETQDLNILHTESICAKASGPLCRTTRSLQHKSIWLGCSVSKTPWTGLADRELERVGTLLPKNCEACQFQPVFLQSPSATILMEQPPLQTQ